MKSLPALALLCLPFAAAFAQSGDDFRAQIEAKLKALRAQRQETPAGAAEGATDARTATSAAEPLVQPLALIIGFTWRQKEGAILMPGNGTKELQRHLTEEFTKRFPDNYVSVYFADGQAYAEFFPKKAPGLCGALEIRFAEGPSLTGKVAVDVTGALNQVVGARFDTGAVYGEFDDRFRVSSRGGAGRSYFAEPYKREFGGADPLPYGVTAWSPKAGPCVGADCPQNDDHHHELILFHSAGDAVLSSYFEALSLSDVLTPLLAVGYGPFTLSLDGLGLKLAPSAGTKSLKVGGGKSFQLLTFKRPPTFATPSGGAAVRIGYSVASVRDGKPSVTTRRGGVESSDEADYIFSSAVGLKAGENQVRTDAGHLQALKADYGQNTGGVPPRFEQRACPDLLQAEGRKIWSGGCFEGTQPAESFVYENTRAAPRESSVLSNRISFIAVDVSLDLQAHQIPASKVPLYLTFEVWPESLKK